VASTPLLLFLSACSTAIIHALIPDHWLPFALMARAQGWSVRRTLTLVGTTGAIHAGVSIALGTLVYAAGSGTAHRLAGHFQASSGIVGGWLMLLFGIGYGLLAHLREARAHHPAGHAANGSDAGGHEHLHAHGHLLSRWSRGTITGGALVAIIGISPCVLLQPILFAAGAEGLGVAAVAAAGFALCTVGTMLAVTWAASRGMDRLNLPFFARYGDLASGLMLAALGVFVIVQEY
jgi:nickel/cobalt transporter (NicO) family protein